MSYDDNEELFDDDLPYQPQLQDEQPEFINSDLLREEYVQHVDQMQDIEASMNNKFAEQICSGYQLDTLIALRRLPGIISHSLEQDFKSDIFPIVMQIAASHTEVVDKKNLIPDFDDLCDHSSLEDQESNVSIAAFTKVDLKLFFRHPQDSNTLLYVQKCLILELIPQILHSFLYCQDYTATQEDVLLQQSNNILKFVMPILYSLIQSTLDIQFQNRAYQMLILVLQEMETNVRIQTTDYLGFSKIQHYKLPFLQNNVQDKKIYYTDILDEFNEIVTHYFVMLPYLRLMVTFYRIDVQEVSQSIFSTYPLACLNHFSADTYECLRKSCFPHRQQGDYFVQLEDVVQEDQINIIMTGLRKWQQPLFDAYIQYIQQLSNYFPMRAAIPILTILIKQLNSRPLYVQFFRNLCERFYIKKGKLIKYYIDLIHHNVEASNEYSQSAPQNIFEGQLKILTVISTVLNNSQNYSLQKSSKFCLIQEEIIQVLLLIKEDDIIMKIPFFLPTYLKNISTHWKLKCCQYYHNNIKSQNKKVVQQFILYLGNFLPEMLSMNFEDLTHDRQKKQPEFAYSVSQLEQLVEYFLDLCNSTFSFKELNVIIKDHVKFQRIFSEKNLVYLPQVCQLSILMKRVLKAENVPQILHEVDVQRERDQLSIYILRQMKLNQPLAQRYALSNEFLRDSSSFRYILSPTQTLELFTTSVQMINLSQLKTLIEQQHLDAEWEASLGSIRQIVLRLFFNCLEEKQNDQSIAYCKLSDGTHQFFRNGNLYVQEQQQAREYDRRGGYTMQCQVTYARNYRSRLEFAQLLPKIIAKVAGRSQHSFDTCVLQLLDVILYYINEPVRKIRTTFCRQLGVLSGLLINKKINISSVITLLVYLITGRVEDERGDIAAALRCVLPGYRPMVQTKCLIMAILYQIIRIAREKAYAEIKTVLMLLSTDAQKIVKSSVIKNLHYLAQNKCNVVFEEDYEKIIHCITVDEEGRFETDQVIVTFVDQFNQHLKQFRLQKDAEGAE